MHQPVIEKLDIPTRVKLRSSHILTSLSQIVSELVQNSLDAGAVSIDIGVDCEEWSCWVKDNGSGITRDGLSLLASGSEEGRYGSSKSYQSDALKSHLDFGFRGEALASAADLGCLEISSRTAYSRDTWSIITKGGKNLYSGPAVRWRRESSGTAVCIRDAFYNLPVRRLSHSPPARTLELIRQELETYALVFPNVAFTLENTHNESGPSRGRTFKIPKTSSSLATFWNLYGRALAEHVETIDSQLGSLKLEGFVSLNGAHSKSYQFLYVNQHPIARCDLHHAIDSVFGASSFGKNALDEAGEIDLPRSTVRRSPRKVERKPVYVLNLTVPAEQVDNFIEPAKTHIQFRQKDVVMHLLSSTVANILTRHGFLVPGQSISRPGSNRGSPSPRKRRKVASDEDLDLVEASGLGEPPSRAGNENDRPIVHLYTVGDTLDAQDITWTDPRTGGTFIVDPRTGNSHPPAPVDGCSTSALRDDRRRRTIPCCGDPPTAMVNTTNRIDPPEWLQKALQANRTYQVGENLVSKLASSRPQDISSEPIPGVRHLFYEFRSELRGPTSGKRQHCFKKEDLHRAIVIDQVDKKFIACLLEDHVDDDDERLSGLQLPIREGYVLVLIDQHAADERIRVERFLKDICSGFMCNQGVKDGENAIKIKEFSTPFPVLLTSYEARRLGESFEIQEAFRHWGFHFNFREKEKPHADEYTTNDDSSGSDYTQVFVQSIPEVVSDKLLLGDELRDLVKGFLGQLESEMPPAMCNASVYGEEDGESSSWLKALRWCPRGLLDLINSKACRGAIMFNDSLSVAQCKDLVHQLSETAFPFQCAHGRPSLVPLTNIGKLLTRNKGALRWSKLEEEVVENVSFVQ